MTALTDEQLAMLEGHLLGDGHLSIGEKAINPRLRINRAGEDLAFCQWTASKFPEVISARSLSTVEVYDARYGKTYSRAALVTRRSPLFLNTYNRWYVQKEKFVPADFSLSRLSITVWFADDGSLHLKKGGGVEVKLNTSGFSLNCVDRLLFQLNQRYGHTFSKYGNYAKGKGQYVIMGSSRAARQLVNDIAPVFDMLPRKQAIWKETPSLFLPALPLCQLCGHDAAYLNGQYRGRGATALSQRLKCNHCGYAWKVPLFDKPMTPKSTKRRQVGDAGLSHST